jgi:hypothetical protein
MNDKNGIQNEDKLNYAKSSFLKIINSLDNSEQIKQFNEFVEKFLAIKEIDEYELSNGFTHLTLDITKNNVNNVSTLESIKDKLRNKLSITAEAPIENIVIPETAEVRFNLFS